MIQLTDAAVLANNEAIGIMPNTLMYTEGFGEQSVRAVSIGDGKTEQVFARNLETNFSTLKFELPTTPENIELARSWKAAGNENVFQIAGSAGGQEITRTFSQAVLINDYEVEIGTETTISIEIRSNSAI